jgi:hypothetical protein
VQFIEHVVEQLADDASVAGQRRSPLPVGFGVLQPEQVLEELRSCVVDPTRELLRALVGVGVALRGLVIASTRAIIAVGGHVVAALRSVVTIDGAVVPPVGRRVSESYDGPSAMGGPVREDRRARHGRPARRLRGPIAFRPPSAVLPGAPYGVTTEEVGILFG